MPTDYNLASYERIIRSALDAGFRFEAFHAPLAGTARVLLRHDVDYSLSMAVELAQVNARLGVAGTFFLLLRGQVYNLLSPWSLRQARELGALGQHVALHYTVPDDTADDLASLASAIQQDFDLLRTHLSAVPVVSWHNPTPAILERTRDWCPPGLINAYHHRFVADIRYLSDSNFRNSCQDFLDALQASTQPIQLLFHPINWVAAGDSMLEVFARAWPRVIRDRELEFLTNRVYRNAFPDGMPAAVLAAFAENWLRAARGPA